MCGRRRRLGRCECVGVCVGLCVWVCVFLFPRQLHPFPYSCLPSPLSHFSSDSIAFYTGEKNTSHLHLCTSKYAVLSLISLPLVLPSIRQVARAASRRQSPRDHSVAYSWLIEWLVTFLASLIRKCFKYFRYQSLMVTGVKEGNLM